MKKKTNNFFSIAMAFLFAVSVVSLSGCAKDWQDDIDGLRTDVDKNTSEIATLKSTVKTLQDLVNSGKVITAVDAATNTTTGATGFKLTFSDKSEKFVWNGLDGEDGAQGATGSTGATGPAGAAGKTPLITIGTDNCWYVDYQDGAGAKAVLVNGNKVTASGADGKDGRSISVDKTGATIVFVIADADGENEERIDTQIPTDSKNIISTVVEGVDKVTITLANGDAFNFPKEAIYPSSITMMQEKATFYEGYKGKVAFRVNPSHAKVELDAISVDYVEDFYTRAAGDFTVEKVEKVKDASGNVVPGLYEATIATALTAQAAPCAVFIVSDSKDTKGNPITIHSATPVKITVEAYHPITDADVVPLNTPAIEATIYTNQVYTPVFDFINAFDINTLDPAKTKITIAEADKAYVGFSNATYAGSQYTFTATPIQAAFADMENGAEKVINIVLTIEDEVETVVTRNIKLTIKKAFDQSIALSSAIDVWIPATVAGQTVVVDLSANEAYKAFMAAFNNANFTITPTYDQQFGGNKITYTFDKTTGKITNNIAWDVAYNHIEGVLEADLDTDCNAVTLTATSGTDVVGKLVIHQGVKIKAPVFKVAVKTGEAAKFTEDVYGVLSNLTTSTVTVSNIMDKTGMWNASSAESPAYNIDGAGYGFITDPTSVVIPGATWATNHEVKTFVKLKSGQEIPAIIVEDKTTEKQIAIGKFYINIKQNKILTIDALDREQQYSQDNNLTGDFANWLSIKDQKELAVLLNPKDARIASFSFAVKPLEFGEGKNPPIAGNPTALITADGANQVGFTTIKGYTWSVNAVVTQKVEVTITDIWGNVTTKELAIKLRMQK